MRLALTNIVPIGDVGRLMRRAVHIVSIRVASIAAEIVLLLVVMVTTAAIIGLVVNDIAHELLQRFEPHSEDRAELCEAVDVAGHIENLHVTHVLDQVLCEIIAVFGKGVVVFTMPEVAKRIDDVIDLICAVVSHTHGQRLF